MKRKPTTKPARTAQPFEGRQTEFNAAVKRLRKQPLVAVREHLLVALTALIVHPDAKPEYVQTYVVMADRLGVTVDLPSA